VTTAAAVSGNVATLTFGSSPVAAGFVNGRSVLIVNFAVADSYFNGTYTLTGVTASTITYALTHGNASSASNGGALQFQTASAACIPAATVYSDSALTTTLAQPFSDDGKGNVSFFGTPSSLYYLGYFASGISPLPLNPVTIPVTPNASGSVSLTSPTTTGTDNGTETLTNKTITGTHITPVVFPALSGSIRLANSDPIVGRNSSNNGDESIISLGTPDEVVLGQVGLPTVVEGGTLRGLGNFTITNEPILGTGNGSSITVLAVNGVGAGSHTGGSVTLTPGNGNNGGANGTVGVTAGYYFFPPAFTNGTLGTPSNGAVVYCSDCTIANPCAGGGAGAIAKRLSGAWVCN